MAILSLRFVPDAVLRAIAQPVAAVTPEILKLLDDMVETMYDAEGIGLAAPQIGISQRVIVMDVSSRDEGEPLPYKMINPEIIASSDHLVPYEEGCLSIPDVRGEVMRPDSVTVRYMDINGQTQEIVTTGLLATCVQHEIDHLNGKLFIDYLSPLRRNMLMRRYNKLQKA